MTAALARVIFCVAVATTAAAMANPIVEGLSNAGVFGRGLFTDHSNADVVPSLCVGLLFAAAFVFQLARGTLSRRRRSRVLLRRSVDALPSGTVLRLLPATFAIQIGVLFGIETLEQIAVVGHPLAGTIWLGGPVAISLAIHAVMVLAVAACFRSILQALAQNVVDAVTFARRLVTSWPESRPAARVPVYAVAAYRNEPALDRLKGRAPPPLPF